MPSSAIGQFAIGISGIGSVPNQSVLTPGPVTVQNTIPAVPYVQHNDDPNITCFFTAYNQYSQAYVNWFNSLNLPIYSQLSGSLLDFVLTNLYGFSRPSLPAQGTPSFGPYNTYGYNAPIPYNGFVPSTGTSYTATTDDVYQRCATWLFYKGDGIVFSPKWLKRRIHRFLNFSNGTSGNIDNTYDVNVAFTGYGTATITLASSPISIIFKEAVVSGVLPLPFQITWTVTL